MEEQKQSNVVPEQQVTQSSVDMSPPAQSIGTFGTGQPNHKKRNLIIVSVVILLVIAVALAVFFVLSSNDDNNEPSPSSQSLSSSEPDRAEELGSIEVENRGTFYKQSPSDTTTVYAALYNQSTQTFSDDLSKSITVNHPNNFEVYKRLRTTEDGLQSVFIKSPKGNYLHIFDTAGVGGDCYDEKKEVYTLVKKLPTGNSDIFFTQYSTDADDGWTPSLSLEDYSNTTNHAYTNQVHRSLEEGGTNTDLCNMNHYPSPLPYVMVVVSKSNVSSLSGGVTYEDISEDVEFVDMLRSLRVVR